MKKFYLLMIILLTTATPSIWSMEAPEEEEMQQLEEIMPQTSLNVYINTIINETNEVPQVIYDGKQVVSIPAGRSKQVRITLSLEPREGQPGWWGTPPEEQGKGLSFWFRPSERIYHFEVEVNRKGDEQIRIDADFSSITAHMKKIESANRLEFAIEKGTKEIQIGIDIILKEDRSGVIAEIDFIPILKS